MARIFFFFIIIIFILLHINYDFVGKVGYRELNFSI